MRAAPIVAAVAALLTASSCASGPPVLRPAHGRVASGAREDLWRRAQALLRERGDETALADPVRGILVSKEAERTVPCGASSCLAREILHLRIDDSRVVLTLSRRTWDTALRAWVDPGTPEALDAIEREERSILADLGAADVQIRASRAGEGCSADADCAGGMSCVSRRCVNERRR